MAKLQFTLIDSGGTPQAGQTVRIKISGTSTIVASTVSSDTGGTATIVDNGDGTYITDDDYSTYLSSGNLITGTYDIYKDATIEIEGYPHIAPTDVGSALLAANNLSDVASAATARTNLGLAIGTNVQAWSTWLDTAASLFSTWDVWGGANSFLSYNGSGFVYLSAGSTRTALGLGDSAVADVGTGSGDVAAGDHNHDADYVGLVNGYAQIPKVNESLPTASSSYMGQLWCRSTGSSFTVYICVRTANSAYAWRKLIVDDGAAGTEEADYSWTPS